jgi:alkanesulfonate monooxygenase SsuD/methylene tetrahydromethanopterin reductase-like flavin-dependent oxidoreductase (luciferase family)
MVDALKVALTAWPSAEGWRADALGRQAEVTEAMGFHALWLPESHFGDQRSTPSPLTLLAAAAARTARIKLGTTSYLLPIRNPLLAAEEVAVVDQLSNGRVILGVGRGVQAAMFRAFAVDASDKRELFQRHLEQMREAWQGKPVLQDENGKPVCLAPLPVQRPHPPVWVAAFGPLALRQAALLGLPYLASPLESLAALEENYQNYHRDMHSAGLPRVHTVPVMRTVFITENPGEAATVRRRLENAVPAAMRHRSGSFEDWSIVGDRHYASDRLGEYVERLGMSHLIARGGVPGIDDSRQMRSHEALLGICSELRRG